MSMLKPDSKLSIKTNCYTLYKGGSDNPYITITVDDSRAVRVYAGIEEEENLLLMHDNIDSIEMSLVLYANITQAIFTFIESHSYTPMKTLSIHDVQGLHHQIAEIISDIYGINILQHMRRIIKETQERSKS